MLIQTCTFDRARAIGFRLLFAVVFTRAAHAEWITRNEPSWHALRRGIVERIRPWARQRYVGI
jgi:hypothetical protein